LFLITWNHVKEIFLKTVVVFEIMGGSW